jgi:hypothetical protein
VSAVRVDTDTGAILASVGAFTVAQDPQDAGWWLVSCVIVNNASGNTSLTSDVFPATAAHGVGRGRCRRDRLRRRLLGRPRLQRDAAALHGRHGRGGDPGRHLQRQSGAGTRGPADERHVRRRRAGRLAERGHTANACDALVNGTEKRRTIGLVMDQVQDMNAWFEALRAYAGCFLARSAGKLVLIPDRPASSTFTASGAHRATCASRA